jgi:Ni/Co efflux regulator RcnB
MIKTLLTATLSAALLATTAGAALAQPGRHDDRGPPGAERRDDRGPPGFERRADRHYKAPRYAPPRGYQARAWHRGDRLPAEYRGRGYVVDYRAYRLAPPPRGYQYVRVGNDVVLTAVATGVIASVISELFQ